MKLDFFDFQKNFKHQISRKSISDILVVSCGETDRHEEANSRFSQFCERV